MKKLLLTLGLLFMGSPLLAIDMLSYADLPVKSYDSFVSTRVYVVSVSSQITFSTMTNVIIASFPVVVQNLVIGKAGSWDASVDLYNAMISTTNGVVDLLYSIDLTSMTVYRSSDWKTYFSSGLCIYNRGTIPADFTINLRRR